MRVEGRDFTKKDADVLVIKLPSPEPDGFWAKLRNKLSGSGDGFELSILPPTKDAYDALYALASSFDDLANGKLKAEDFDLDGTFDTVARIMSRNAERREVTPSLLSDLGFDLSDAGEFIASYIMFIGKLVAEKN